MVVGMSKQLVGTNWIPDTSTFAARLALVRWRMGWNQKEAATECNLTQNSWGNWEEGVNPRNYVETINRIVLRTGVNKTWLMTGEGSPENTPSENSGKSQFGDLHAVGVIRHVDFTARRKLAVHN